MKKGWIAVAVTLTIGALVWALVPEPTTPAPPTWPAGDAPVAAPVVTFPADFGTQRVFVDAGHGAEDNTGNRSALCRDEQDFTLALAGDLAAALAATGHFEVKVSREPGVLVPYRERVGVAEQWGAAVFISLHSDVRGKTTPWSPDGRQRCPRSRQAPGFTVLWSDEGEPSLRTRRLQLARSLAHQLEAMGLPAYDGTDYQGLYGADDQQPGVFVDRHPPGERIFVLRKPTMPSVIVETHNAVDDREALRWEEARVRQAFAASVAAALVELLSPAPTAS